MNSFLGRISLASVMAGVNMHRLPDAPCGQTRAGTCGRRDMGKLKEIVIDADHPAGLARFWAQVVDGYAVRPYDDAEIARLAALGLTPETDPTVMVDGPGPTSASKRAGPRPLRNRMHLDLGSPDREAEVARLMALGATLLARASRTTRRCATPRATSSA